MYEVNIEIGADASKYWASLAFEDRNGNIREKQIGADREASKNSNFLQALIEAVKELQVPCMVNVYTNSEYIIEPYKQGWISKWEKNEWRNAKGNQVRNAAQWQEARKVLARHSVRFFYTDGRR